MKIKMLLIISIFLLTTGCKTFIAGSPVDSFKNMTPKDAGYMVVGAVASLAVHEGAHMVTCEIVGADYSLHGLSVEYSGNLSESDHRWINRAGLLTQNVVGLFLDSSNFSKGFKILSAIETLTYPLQHSGDGDLYNIKKHGGNAALEWQIYNALAVYNLLRIEW